MANAQSRADTDQSQAGAGAHGVTGQDAHAVHASDMDVVGSRMQRDNQDIGSDERMSVENVDRSGIVFGNLKRTADQYQSLDHQALVDKAKHQAKLDSMEIQAAEQRLLHQAKVNSQEIAERNQDHAQRVRFADANSSVQIALLADMAEKLGEVHGIVCNNAAKA